MNTASPGRAEWQRHWTVVLAAFVGLSMFALPSHTVGIMIQPLTEEFGWSRTEVTAGMSLGVILTVILSPIVGSLVDRFGPRRVALPGVLLTGLSFAGMGFANGSPRQWLLLWTMFGAVHIAVSTMVWTTAVSKTFSHQRSMALGVALCGVAFAGIFVPPLARWMADGYGWRTAYQILGLGWGGAAFAICLLFLFTDPAVADPQESKPAADEAAQDGLTIAQALRSVPLYRIGLSTLIVLTLGSTLITHKVPMLTELGVTRENAALLTSLTGVAGVCGKLVTGWLMQRFDAGWVGGITNALTAVSLVWLLEPFRSPSHIVISMVVMGYAAGTKLQISAYLTTIYAGMRNFGKIFGVMASLVAIGGGFGPMLGGIIYDLSGSYNLLILGGIPATLIASALIIRLGPFPPWSAALQPQPVFAQFRKGRIETPRAS